MKNPKTSRQVFSKTHIYIHVKCFQKSTTWCFPFFYFQFFITLEKYARHTFFNYVYFLHICLFPQSIETTKLHLTIFFMGKNLLFRQNNYIYLFKKCHQYWFRTNRVTLPKKYLFMKFHCPKFFRSSS